jgi:hypothetical protein
MFLQRTEQFHDFLVEQCAYFAQRICFTTGLSGCAPDREHHLDLIRRGWKDSGFAAFVTKRVDERDH